ncbi:MAG: hypothetical protein Q8L36_01860 [bacterium]|nr:hypothetical protein [bacterium]
MNGEKKFFLDSHENLKSVLKAVNAAKEKELTIVLPHDSVFGKNLDNFEALKKELKKSKKSVAFESVNENILQLAEIAGFRISHPLFQREERIFSDILPNNNGYLNSIAIPKKIEISDVSEETEEDEIDFNAVNEKEETVEGEVPPEKMYVSKKKRIRQPINSRRLFFRILIGTGFAGLIFLVLIFLPKATISLSLKKFETSFEKPVEASVNIKKTEIKNGKIFLAGELLVAKKNIQMNFAASGRENVESKARGKLTIYNSFGSQSQSLVATTRFLSPDGKIFRLDNSVTVPGAKVINGKIEPSSIEVAVTAEKIGPDYNLVASSEKWRIPGFQGTPKYDGFYAEVKSGLSGGFVGERAMPTTDDLQKAKAAIEEALKGNLLNQLAVLMADDLKLLPEAQSFSLISFQTNDVGADGQFGVFAEAELRYFVFKENDLKSTLTEDLKKSIEGGQNLNIELGAFEADYQNKKFDLAQGSTSFLYKGKAIFQPVFNTASFIDQVSGLSEDQLREKMLAIPGLEKGKISLWPFWVKSAPPRSERIVLSIE